MYTLVLFIGLAVVSASATLDEYEIFDGPCPSQTVDTVQDFQHFEFYRYWYVIQRYRHSTHKECVRMLYDWNDRRIFYMAYQESKLEDGSTQAGLVDLFEKEQNSNNGKFVFRETGADYYFVDTDYVNYAVAWACDEDRDASGKVINKQNLLVMARNRAFDINSMDSLNATLAKQPFDRSRLKHVEQLDQRCYR